MTRDWLLNALATCDRHIAASDLILAAQKVRIEAGEAAGRDVSGSRSLMDTFQESHRLHVAQRAQLILELASVKLAIR